MTMTIQKIAALLMTSYWVRINCDETVISIIASHIKHLEDISKEFNLEILSVTNSSDKLFVTGEFKLK